MFKTNNELQKLKNLADLFIVVLDARAPLSTYNHDFDKLAPNTPRLFVLSKSDLADINKKNEIEQHLIKKNNDFVWINLLDRSQIQKIRTLASKMIVEKIKKNEKKGIYRQQGRIIVIGVPNSGKSTLINGLAGRKVAHTANRPGITRTNQWINLKTIQIMDTPGLLWPKFDDDLIGIKLAIIGSINPDVLELFELAAACLKLISHYYPRKLIEFGADIVKTDEDAYREIEKLAFRNNWLTTNSKPNLDRTMKYIVRFTKRLKGVTYD